MNLVFFDIIPSHFCRALKVSKNWLLQKLSKKSLDHSLLKNGYSCALLIQEIEFFEHSNSILKLHDPKKFEFWKCHGNLLARLPNVGFIRLVVGRFTWNFGSSFVFSRPSNLRGQILPNMIFCAEKRHISGKMQVPLCQKTCFLS